MGTDKGIDNGRRRRITAVVVAGLGLAAVAVVALVLLLSSSGSGPGPVTSSKVEIKRQLVTLLHEHSLEPHWVACVPSGRSYEGAAVVRCNVNYGDPHIEAICSVLQGGELLTNHDEAAIPCQHDNRGWHPLVRTFG